MKVLSKRQSRVGTERQAAVAACHYYPSPKTPMSSIFFNLDKDGCAFASGAETCLLKALVSSGKIDIAQQTHVSHRTEQSASDLG